MSEVFTVITETREARTVKLISVVVKRFTDVCLFIRVQLVEFLQKR
ncbi:mobilization protein [Clavibacter cf. michiganensis LMG 26808]|nr:mobilization protein [Clavibacter cf. michiganensis LMG 26808]